MTTQGKRTEGEPYLWNVMVYLSGDNNLSPEMIWAINEMGSVQLPYDDRLAITIQYDPRSASFPPMRYRLTSETQGNSRPTEWSVPLPGSWAERVDGVGAEDFAAAETLTDFIEWSGKTCPSRYRMLILSGHGSGIVGDFLTDERGKREQPTALTVHRLKEALDQAAKRQYPLDSGQPLFPAGEKLFHILGMDSCLMSMAEVCYALDPQVKFLIGSEGFALTTGWPYGDLLKSWVSNWDAVDEPNKVCERLVDDYLEYYKDQVPAGVSVDIAACDVERFGTEVVVAVKELTDAIEAATRDDEKHLTDPAKEAGRDVSSLWDFVVLAHWRAQSFKFEQYTDLGDFCEELRVTLHEHGGSYSGVMRACDRVVQALKKAVISQGSNGIEYQYSQGLSVYFPWSCPLRPAERWSSDFEGSEKKFLKSYTDGREFTNPSGWGNFLMAYLKNTRRPPGLVRNGTSATHALVDGKQGSAIVRFSPDFNRHSPDFNRHLTTLYGDRLPWSMKNPPQTVKVSGLPDSGGLEAAPAGGLESYVVEVGTQTTTTKSPSAPKAARGRNKPVQKQI